MANISNKIKSTREAGMAVIGSLLEHTESLKELKAVHGDKKLRK